MAQRTTLAEHQIAILRWIADGCPDGCPDGVMPDLHHRISAAALRSRGLIKITGKGPTWKATITPAGTEYLDTVASDTPPVPRQGNVSVTQQLIDQIVAAGGELRVPRRSYYDRDGVDYEQRARIAERHGKVPAGKWLEIERQPNEIILRLEDAPVGLAEAAAELQPVPVPQDVARYHPAARQFRDNKAEHQVSRDHLMRATRILHAVATETQRRGWKCTADRGGARIEPSGISVALTLKEKGVHLRGPWDAEVKRSRSSTWWYGNRPKPTGDYDQDASGELELTIEVTPGGGFEGRQYRWSDRQSWILEERLPHLFQEIAMRIVLAQRHAVRQRIAAERAAEAARQAKAERERQWHAHMTDARERLIETSRAEQLRADAAAWREAQHLRDYCAAVAEAHAGNPDTQEYLSWAERHIDTLDPLTVPPALPPTPDPTPDALQPYLPSGWSAHGPEHGHHAYRRW